jgi:hypothetical protein
MRKFTSGWGGVAGGLAVASLLLAGPAAADNVCNGFLDFSYQNAIPVHGVGDTIGVTIELGTGDITGGPLNTLTIGQLGFDLSCKVPPNPVPGCVSEGPVMDFADSFTTNCPTTWSFTRVGDHVTAVATPPVVMPANTFPFCEVSFNEKTLAPSTNPAGFIEQVASFDQAKCDSGLLDAGGFQTGEVLVEQPANFDCYQVPRGKILPQAVTVVDQFSDFSTVINNLHRLCAPADIILPGGQPAGGVNFDGVHLAAYDIPFVTGTTQHPIVTIATKLNSFVASVGSPIRLAVPTAKSFAGPPPQPPVGVVPNMDCYSLKSFKINGLNGVTVIDQFARITLDIDKRGPLSLCVAATVNGVPPTGQPQALVCNHTKNDGPFGQASPFITNIFESQQILVTQFDELCVPAIVIVH